MTSGTVTEFDDDRGLGVITGADGRRYDFHCVEISDGSRSIAVGSSVTFDLLAKFGRFEAARIRT